MGRNITENFWLRSAARCWAKISFVISLENQPLGFTHFPRSIAQSLFFTRSSRQGMPSRWISISGLKVRVMGVALTFRIQGLQVLEMAAQFGRTSGCIVTRRLMPMAMS